MTPLETPVEWLEKRSIQRTDNVPDGRIPFLGGWTTLAQIKSDECKCRSDLHMGTPDAYRFTMSRSPYFPAILAHWDEESESDLDPYDVAVKRGSPA